MAAAMEEIGSIGTKYVDIYIPTKLMENCNYIRLCHISLD